MYMLTLKNHDMCVLLKEYHDILLFQMSKKNYYIYLEFSYSELNIVAFNKINNKL